MEQHFFNFRPSEHNRSKVGSKYSNPFADGTGSEKACFNPFFPYSRSCRNDCPHCDIHLGSKEHSGSYTCSHCRPKINKFTITASIFLFILGMLIPNKPSSNILFVTSYILSAYPVILSLLKNLSVVSLFDKNFIITFVSACIFPFDRFAEASAVMLLFRFGEAFEEYTVQNSVRAVKSMLIPKPGIVTVIRNGRQIRCKPEDVDVGEIIFVKAGEKFPLDGKISEGKTMLDMSPIMGKSSPVSAEEGSPVLSGCVNLSDAVSVEVTSPYNKSTISQITNITKNASLHKSSFEKSISLIAGYYTPVVCAISALTAFVAPLIFGGKFSEWIYRALIFLAVSCPCALALSIPLAYFGSIASFAKNGILIKDGDTIQNLCKLHTVAFDKTGTITDGKMSVRAAISVDGVSEEDLLSIAATAEYGLDHPVANAIVSAVPGFVPAEVGNFSRTEYPGKGVHFHSDKSDILVGSPEFFAEQNISFFPAESEHTVVYVAINGKFIGVILISDCIRSNAKESILSLEDYGIQESVLLTGDCKNSAEAVAKKVGIDEYYSNLLSSEKSDKINEIKANIPKNRTTAFISNSENDVASLAAADVGIAIDGMRSKKSIENSDVILMSDNLRLLEKSIELSQKMQHIIIQDTIIFVSVKLILMLLAACGLLTIWLAVWADFIFSVIAVLNSSRTVK